MEILKDLRKKKNVYQKTVADAIGVSRSTYASYEIGTREPDFDVISKLADYFKVTVDYLLGREEEPKSDMFEMPTMKEVPLVGTIACGEPITAEENIERYIEVVDKVDVDFALECKGDSMIGARIYDGDIVFIKQQSHVDNGTIAAVLIGDEATLKRVYFYPDKNMVILKAENKDYEDLIYAGEELDQIRILGKAVSFMSFVR